METQNLDTLPLPSDNSESWAEGFAASLHAQREGARRFFASNQAKLEQAEAELEKEIERLEAAVENRTTDADRGIETDHDYQRRYEMALDDLRELKEKNAELVRQLAKCPSTEVEPSGAARTLGTYLDWETEKQRILAILEADSDSNDPKLSTERLRIEEVLRTTERVLAEKDREIADLKRQLEKLPSGIESGVSAAPVSNPAIDGDAVVQEERERLRQLQMQWQEKLSQAEIEISMERAKLARQRSELEEQMRLVESNATQGAGAATAAGHAASPARGRWLSRLGLTDADRERSHRR